MYVWVLALVTTMGPDARAQDACRILVKLYAEECYAIRHAEARISFLKLRRDVQDNLGHDDGVEHRSTARKFTTLPDDQPGLLNATSNRVSTYIYDSVF